jgi:hypothetical protein
MKNIQCFKIKPGTNYDKEVKRHFALLPKWGNVFDKVGELLGEKITQMALSTDELYLDISELKKEDNKKLFTKDGKLKKSSKGAKQILDNYKAIIKTEGLEDFQELRFINFSYGVMRLRGQKLESFRTSEDDIYYKADFDLEKKTDGMVIPISQIEYEEKYLEELKKQEQEQQSA